MLPDIRGIHRELFVLEDLPVESVLGQLRVTGKSLGTHSLK